MGCRESHYRPRADIRHTERSGGAQEPAGQHTRVSLGVRAHDHDGPRGRAYPLPGQTALKPRATCSLFSEVPGVGGHTAGSQGGALPNPMKGRSAPSATFTGQAAVVNGVEGDQASGILSEASFSRTSFLSAKQDEKRGSRGSVEGKRGAGKAHPGPCNLLNFIWPYTHRQESITLDTSRLERAAST